MNILNYLKKKIFVLFEFIDARIKYIPYLIRFYKIKRSLGYRPSRIKIFKNRCKKNYEKIKKTAKEIRLIFTPKNANNYFNLGVEYYNEDQFDKAIKYFSKAIKIDPENAKFYINRAEAYSDNELPDLAVLDFNEAIRLEPENDEYYFMRGYFFYEEVKSELALKDYTRAIEINPDNSDYYKERSYLYRWINEEKNINNMISDYTEVIRLEPENSNFYSCRGDSYFKIRQFEKAAKDYTDALFFYKKEEHGTVMNEAYGYGKHVTFSTYYKDALLINRSYAYYKNGQYDNAIADYNELLKKDPDNSVYYHNRGRVYAEKGRYDNAIADLNKAIDLSDYRAYFLLTRGDVLYRLGRYDEAFSDYSSAIKLRPNEASYYTIRGNAYKNTGNIEKADSDFNEAAKLINEIKLLEDTAFEYTRLGKIYFHRYKTDKDYDHDYIYKYMAKEELNKAIEIDPDYEETYKIRAALNYDDDYSEGAVKDYNEAIRLNPNNAEYFYLRGKAYHYRLERPQYDKAMADYKEALRLDPDCENAKEKLLGIEKHFEREKVKFNLFDTWYNKFYKRKGEFEIYYPLPDIMKRLRCNDDKCFEHLLRIYYHRTADEASDWITVVYDCHNKTYKDNRFKTYLSYKTLYYNLWVSKENFYVEYHNDIIERLNSVQTDLPKIEQFDIEGSKFFCKCYYQWLSEKFSTVGKVTLEEVEDKINELLNYGYEEI